MVESVVEKLETLSDENISLRKLVVSKQKGYIIEKDPRKAFESWNIDVYCIDLVLIWTTDPTGSDGIRNHDLCDAGAMLYQMSYEANQLRAGQFVRLIWSRVGIPLEPPEFFRCV